MKVEAYLAVLGSVTAREFLRFVHQRERLVAALVRPLLWLVVFAAGFRAALGVSIIPPYETYVPYEVYIVPGLCGMILLFATMQASLAMVYDRAMGAMRVLLTSPFPRWFLLLSKLVAGVVIAVLQVYAFLAIAFLYGIDLPPAGFVTVAPALLLGGLLIGAAGLLIASFMRRVDNFAGVMNFVIFPAFFLSTALYPLWKMREASDWLGIVCSANPFTYVVELIRFALYGEVDLLSLAVVVAATCALLAAAIWSYDPARGFRAARTVGSDD